MLKLNFSALSVGASVDQQTGNLSVFDLIEEVRVPEVPMQIPALVISLALEKESPSPFDGKIMIHLITPDGKPQPLGSGEMKVPADQRRMKAVFRYGGMPIMAFGRHRFVLSWLDAAGAKQGEAILDFDVLAAPAAPRAEPPSAARH